MGKHLNAYKDNLFRHVHNSNLIYNTCWEDPRVDRELLQIEDTSKIVMITSAGCNALDYALDNPAEIHCVDMNFRQNALLELKKAVFKNGDFDLLFEFFGNGKVKGASQKLHHLLMKNMPTYAQEYWAKKIKYFNLHQRKKTFYYRGTAGRMALFINQIISLNKKAKKLLEQLLEADSLEEQTAIYLQLEPLLMNKIIMWLSNRQAALNMLGVPRSQKDLIQKEYPNGGVGSYLKESLRNVFCHFPIGDNYFWTLYLRGFYTKTCCPNYLKKENFEFLSQYSQIQTYTCSLSEFLKKHPQQYTHFVLLDHQDWLAQNDPSALEEEWALILKNATKGAKLLMRSAALKIDFIPSFAMNKIKTNTELSDKLHKKDRVGTYATTRLFEVQ